MYASKSINRRAAAVLAAVFMVCTAFAVPADNSEASAYDDAKAFGDYVNPHAADAPGTFTQVFDGTADLSGIYENEIILVKDDTSLNLDDDTVVVKDSKIYFETGPGKIFITAGDVSFQGDYEVVLGYKEGVSNGFTVDTKGDASVSFMNEVSRDHNTDCVLAQEPGNVIFRGTATFSYLGSEIVVSSYRDNLVNFTFADGDWRLFLPILNTGDNQVFDLELKKSGSSYTCRSITGDMNTALLAATFDPHNVTGFTPADFDMVINTSVSGNVSYTGKSILIEPGFTAAAGTVISLMNCEVVFSPGTYTFADSFQLKLLTDTNSTYGINYLIFGDATMYDYFNEDVDNTAQIPASQLTVTEHGFSLSLSDKMTTVLGNSVAGDGSITVVGTNDSDIVFSVTDRYNWNIAIKSYEFDDVGTGSLSIKCQDGKAAFSRDITFVGGDGKVDMTAEEAAMVKSAAALDPEMQVTFKIDDKYTVVLNSPALQALSGNAATLIVKDTTSDQSALTDKQKETIGDRPVFSISFGDNTNFGSGTVTVTVPYALKGGESPNGIYVAYVAVDGTLEKLPTTYNAEDGTVTFTTTHFSVFTVMAGLTHGNISPAVMAAAALTAAVVAGLVCVVIRSGRY